MRDTNGNNALRIVGRPKTDGRASASGPTTTDNRDPRTTCAVNRSVLPLGVDARRRDAKRLIEICGDLTARLSVPPDLITRNRITSAALLMMRIEAMAEAQGRGESVDANDLVRVNHALSCALRELGIKS